ncbi:MAG: ABC transporter permease, partial [Turicibacter sp.]
IFAIGLFISTVLLIKLQNTRYKEIGLLAALGFNKQMIQKILLIENLLLSSLAVIMYLVLIGTISIISSFTQFAVIITPIQIIGCVLITFAIVIITSAIISYQLIKVEPAKALTM